MMRNPMQAREKSQTSIHEHKNEENDLLNSYTLNRMKSFTWENDYDIVYPR